MTRGLGVASTRSSSPCKPPYLVARPRLLDAEADPPLGPWRRQRRRGESLHHTLENSDDGRFVHVQARFQISLQVGHPSWLEPRQSQADLKRRDSQCYPGSLEIQDPLMKGAGRAAPENVSVWLVRRLSGFYQNPDPVSSGIQGYGAGIYGAGKA